MDDGQRRFDRVLDLHPGAAQFRQVRGVDRQPDGFTVNDGVEGAAERDVGPNRPRRQLHRQAAVQDERRHVHEGHALDPPGVQRRAGPDRPGRRVVDHRRSVSPRHQQAALDRHRRHRDDAVAAHRAVAFVVHEQDAGMRAWRHRLGQPSGDGKPSTIRRSGSPAACASIVFSVSIAVKL